MEWVIDPTHSGSNMIGNRRTKFTSMENEEPPGPKTKPARKTVTVIDRLRSTASTSRRLRKWGDASSPLSGIRPLR